MANIICKGIGKDSKSGTKKVVMLKRFPEILITFASKPNKEITMPYPIEKKFVIAVSSSALFEMKKSDFIFRSKGESAYRAY